LVWEKVGYYMYNEKHIRLMGEFKELNTHCHLTSHPISDDPCICHYVKVRLMKDNGGHPMIYPSYAGVRDAYRQLQREHPEYKRVYFI
jgi:hypothetical protein